MRSPFRKLFGSVRVRVAVLAGVAFAVTLVTASLLLLHTLESRLVSDVRTENDQVLHTQAIHVLTSGLPATLAGGPQPPVAEAGNVSFQIGPLDGQPVVATTSRAATSGGVAGGPTDTMTQMASASTPGLSGIAPLIEFVNGTTQSVTLQSGAVTSDSARLLGLGQQGRVLVSAVQVYPGLSLTTASSLSEVDRTISTTRMVLWYIVPALVLLVMGFAWLLVGRALGPVHALTARASTINARSLHERVPVSAVGDEVSELATTINSMLDRIETSDLASRQLVSDASHELRTPITVMRTELEVARRNPNAAWDDVSANVLTEVDRLQALVDDLLLLARISERGVTPTPFSLLDTVRDVAGRRRSAEVCIVATSAADPALAVADVEVVGDAQAVQRALDHVVANAARHAVAEVALTIDSSRDDGLIAIHVDDDGPGIAEPDRRRVLQRFERLDEARSRDAGGSGLGLAVALDVMTAHGGRVEITDSPLGGARVSLLIAGTGLRTSR